MDLLIISDSHGRGYLLKEVLSHQVRRPEALLFLGDGIRDLEGELDRSLLSYGVRGNCDLFTAGCDAPDERTLFYEGHKLLLCHGHTYGVKGGIGPLLAHGVREGADLVCFGHTHTPYLERIPSGTSVAGISLARDVYLFNPGSLAQGSFGVLHLDGETVLFSHGTL